MEKSPVVPAVSGARRQRQPPGRGSAPALDVLRGCVSCRVVSCRAASLPLARKVAALTRKFAARLSGPSAAMKLQCDVEVVNRMLPTLGMKSRGRGARAVLSIGKHLDKASQRSSVFMMICTAKDRAGSKYKVGLSSPLPPSPKPLHRTPACWSQSWSDPLVVPHMTLTNGVFITQTAPVIHSYNNRLTSENT